MAPCVPKILMLKLPVTPALLWEIWKFELVDVIVNEIPAQAPLPLCEPKTATEPAEVAVDLQRLAVMVGKVLVVPDTQMI